MKPIRNWAQTFTSHPRVLTSFDTVESLAAGLAVARREQASVRILGAAQSPNDMAMSDEHLLVMRGMDRVLAIDRECCEVEAEAGIRLGTLAEALDKQGLALPSLGSILRQTLGGAAATGTHGTGVAWGSLPTWIQSFDMLTVDGETLHAGSSTHAEMLRIGRLGLGSLGIQTAFRLKVVPAFDLRVEQGPVDLAQAMQPEWYGSAEHARAWYLPNVAHAWGWRAWRIAPGPGRSLTTSWLARMKARLLGYHAFEAGLWMAANLPALLPTVNRAYSRAFFSRPKHSTGGSVEQFTFDCLFHQRVTEWAVPLADAGSAVTAVRALAEQKRFQAHLPIEIRFTAGDDIPLSPTNGGPRCWIGLVAYIPYGREIDWRPWFDAFEEAMLGFGGRPHWAKQFNIGPEKLRDLYPGWNEFQALRAQLDPGGRLRNAYTDRVLGRVQQ